ncbi:site-specific integrase [Myroides odoratimimus]|uniref:site-specific integrase n=1 Tax=Myroides odoratimimus TaxID=76832 RepID=UPI0025757F71|nr:site-specific integrase [Myroides odoratimimus]MDO5858421.1 site-specific integrase [Myroides odoratimimus]
MEFNSSAFDTVFDTKNIFVTINATFYIRKDKNDTGLVPIYLSLTSRGERERINLKISIDESKWDSKKQRLRVTSLEDKDVNLVLDNIQAKITGINTVYRLSNKGLTTQIMKEELLNELPRVNFCAFFDRCLEEDKAEMKHGSYKRYKSVLKKMRDYRQEIYFNEIDLRWFKLYRKHLVELGNKTTTINANIQAIKKYLRQAERYGIKLSFNISDIEVGSTAGNRTSLNIDEVKAMIKYYRSEFIQPHHKLSLGYFLFSCFTGLRLSDVMGLTRREVINEIEFTSVKTGKDQIIQINSTATSIVKENEHLFVKYPVEQVLNRQLKDIARSLGINKHLCFHVSRHTFATNFLRVGGNVIKLQKLLGHSKLDTTMKYVHILNSEANEEIFLLDSIFNTEGKRRDTKGN